MRVQIGLLILAVSSSAIAAGQGAPDIIFQSALKVVLVLFGLAAALVAARWLYDWNQCRKATRAATRAVKERVASGQKPYC
ncbi:exported hypothetical protein [Pseudomonas veronii]|uniref:hypothetical protein n=1 Tax=Pseudomonas veronii TaxID=76761 RepID=UPI0017628456|nr:hypothetical protein [Pseudomonas veronii]CAD0264261.1 exported hypothetical protein [Pseudomonas veronii]